MAEYKSLSKVNGEELDEVFPSNGYYCDDCEADIDEQMECDCAYCEAYDLWEIQYKDSI